MYLFAVRASVQTGKAEEFAQRYFLPIAGRFSIPKWNSTLNRLKVTGNPDEKGGL